MSSRSQSARGRSTRWALAWAAVPVAVVMLGGCDTASDKADVRVADAARAAATGVPGSPAIRQSIDAANKETDATPALQIRAKVLLGDDELRQAQAAAAQAAANADRIDELAGGAAQGVAAIQANNALVAALNQYEPTPVLGALKDQSTDITGSEDKPEYAPTKDVATLAPDYKPADPPVMLPSSTGADKSAGTLQQQVDQLSQKIKSETDQRTDLLNKADQLEQQSRREKGAKAVEVYTQSSDARKQAADLAAQVTQDQSALARTQADLAVQQANQQATKASLAAVDTESQSAGQTWDGIKQQIAAVGQTSAKLMGEPSTAAPPKPGQPIPWPATIAAKAAAIDQLRQENDKARAAGGGSAASHFDAAVKAYQDAGRAASALLATLNDPKHLTPASPRPDQISAEAWKAQRTVTDPTYYTYLTGTAQLAQARFHARSAAEFRTVAMLADAMKRPLTTAGLKAPTGLNDSGGSAAAAKQQADAAVKAFEAAIDNLDKVGQGTAPPELKGAANVALMYASYDESKLQSTLGNTTKATDLMGHARSALTDAQQENAAVPALPPELAGPGGQSVVAATPDTTTAAPAMTVASMAGMYKGTGPIAGPGSPTGTATLTLTAKGRFTVSLEAAAPIGKHTLGGGFTVTGTKLTMYVDQTDGKSAPLDAKPEVETIEDGGKRLVPVDGSPPLIRQP